MKRKTEVRLLGMALPSQTAKSGFSEYFMLKEMQWIAIRFGAIMIRVGERCWS